jgi:DNA repair protein RadC
MAAQATDLQLNYEATVRSTLTALGSASPDADLAASDGFWRHCQSAGVSPEVCAAVIYGSIRHQHVSSAQTVSPAQTATLREAAESPTREEWEVVVRRHGASVEKITHTAGRKPDEILGADVIFGNFYDDEKAAIFARRLMKAGFVTFYRPRPKIEAAAAEGDRSALGDDKAAAAVVTTTAVVAAAEGGVQSQIAAKSGTPVTIEKSGCVPWVKVTRDTERYEACIAEAAKHGPINTPTAVYKLLGETLSKEDQEVFLVILLDVHGNLRGVCEVARGQRSRVTVSPADVLRPVIAAGAEGYLVVHCHPSGKARPSKADRDLTQTIKDATKPYGREVTFIDHVVIGSKQYYSIAESKLYKTA